MAQGSTQTLILSFETDKANVLRVQVNQPRAALTGSEVKEVMTELISLGAITNSNEEIVLGIKGAGLTNKTIETISF